ncbi:glucan biosynthesis protein [Escherichia coli]
MDAQFFHMGMGFRCCVRMFSVDPATHLAREIHFRRSCSIRRAGVDTKQLEGQSDLRFAGFRVFKAPELARRDVVSFLGAVISAPLINIIIWFVGPAAWRLTLTPNRTRVPRLYRLLV